MREIKFRAWDSFNKRMCRGNEYKVTFAGAILNSCDIDMVHQLKLLQYTGVKDKNGKEIYEGDIIDYGYYSKEDDTEDLSRPMRFVAKWSQEDSGFVANGRLMTRYQYYAFPVIGNIYENPDLLEEKKGE